MCSDSTPLYKVVSCLCFKWLIYSSVAFDTVVTKSLNQGFVLCVLSVLQCVMKNPEIQYYFGTVEIEQELPSCFFTDLIVNSQTKYECEEINAAFLKVLEHRQIPFQHNVSSSTPDMFTSPLSQFSQV